MKNWIKFLSVAVSLAICAFSFVLKSAQAVENANPAPPTPPQAKGHTVLVSGWHIEGRIIYELNNGTNLDALIRTVYDEQIDDLAGKDNLDIQMNITRTQSREINRYHNIQKMKPAERKHILLFDGDSVTFSERKRIL